MKIGLTKSSITDYPESRSRFLRYFYDPGFAGEVEGCSSI